MKTDKNGSLMVEFDHPQWAVAPGQWVVFYAGEECLGGGRIDFSKFRKLGSRYLYNSNKRSWFS